MPSVVQAIEVQFYIFKKVFYNHDSVNQHVDSTFVVHFSSDGSVTYSGFVLQWQCYAGKLKITIKHL